MYCDHVSVFGVRLTLNNIVSKPVPVRVQRDGKTKTRQESTSASGSDNGSASDYIRAAVMETMTDPTVLAMLAERVADAVFAKFEKRMAAFESKL